jgi:hypothetical protein
MWAPRNEQDDRQAERCARVARMTARARAMRDDRREAFAAGAAFAARAIVDSLVRGADLPCTPGTATTAVDRAFDTWEEQAGR